MRWLRYCLLALTPLVLVSVETNVIILSSLVFDPASRWLVMTIVELAGNAFQLLALLYIWRNPPRLRERVIDPIGMLNEEIKLHPPAPRDPGQDVLNAADRLRGFAR